MGNVKIRRAVLNDIPIIDKLLYQVHKVHSDARPDIFKRGAKKYTDDELKGIICDDKRPIFVAEKDGCIAGYAFCISIEVKDDNSLSDIKTLYIDDLCVDESIRCGHIGTNLYNYVVDFAQKNGYYNVTLNVWADNKNALKFYEHIGLKVQKIGMEKILNPQINIRKALKTDIDGVVSIYEKILDKEEKGEVSVGWIRGIYPTKATAEDALNNDELFVMEDNKKIVAAAKINKIQVPEYKNADWNEKDAPDDKIMVLHTLVVDPTVSGKGYGTKFVNFYEEYALKNGCHYLRMDTNEKNTSARRLYGKLGYTETGIVPCNFNGIEGVGLVCLEKTLK